MRHLLPRIAATASLVTVLATGCGTPTEPATPAEAAEAPAATSVTADSCGREVEFDAAPQRVLAIGSEAPALLVAAGAGDRVTHYAGTLSVPFDPETKAVVEAAEQVIEDSHDLSFEQIVATGVDVAIGTDVGAGVDIDSLAERLGQAGVQLLTVSGYCAGIEGRSTAGLSGFDLIYRDVETYGRVFGTEQTASDAVAEMQERVAAVTEQVADRAAVAQSGTGVALYVTADGPLGAYGGESLVSEQLELLGLANVFADVPKRYFEPATEQLVDSAPAVVLGLFLPVGSTTLATEQDVVDELRSRPELAGVPAVADDAAVLPLNYYYTSPGPLALDGLELLADRLATP